MRERENKGLLDQCRSDFNAYARSTRLTFHYSTEGARRHSGVVESYTVAANSSSSSEEGEARGGQRPPVIQKPRQSNPQPSPSAAIPDNGQPEEQQQNDGVNEEEARRADDEVEREGEETVAVENEDAAAQGRLAEVLHILATPPPNATPGSICISLLSCPPYKLVLLSLCNSCKNGRR